VGIFCSSRLAGFGVITEARPPRIACLLALAHRFQVLLDTGQVRDYAELARLGHVTRARFTQIMNLLLLAPSIQEQLLFWTAADARNAPTERDLRRIAQQVYWNHQESCQRPSPSRKAPRLRNARPRSRIS